MRFGWGGVAVLAGMILALPTRVSGATISNNPTVLQGSVTINLTINLQGSFAPTTGSCALTLSASDPHAGVATSSVNATINGSQVTCAPVTPYYFLANDRTGTITVTYSVSLYDQTGQFKTATQNSYLLAASASNLSPSLSLSLQM